MCLLVVLSRVHSGFPLIVAANRDEFLAREATPMTTLRDAGPKILGGRDELAGGTWLAVNEHGLVAGLTNAPMTRAGRDPQKKSRGELPLALAAHASAEAAAMSFRATIHAADYNPCWLLAGDRGVLLYVDLTVPAEPLVEALPPGIHVLENRPLRAASPKADAVRAALEGCQGWSESELRARLDALLRDHAIPAAARDFPRGDPPRPIETEARCVHAGPYGTKSAETIFVPADPAERPHLRFTPGPSCVTPWQDAPGW